MKLLHDFQRIKNLVAACAISVCVFSTAWADDTEVFFGQVDPSLDIFPNVLFVLDTSGSMQYFDGGTQSRLERMKEALNIILDNSANVNVGMMRFNGGFGGGAVLFPVTPIDEQICREGSCGDVTLSPRISSTDHDMEEEQFGARNVSLNGNILSIGATTGGASQVVGLHFDDLSIPQGVKIKSAKLEFTAFATQTSSANFEITGELTPNSTVFENQNGNANNRPRTNTSVNWRPEAWSTGLIYQTEDISSVIQEIVDQDDWCGGNAMSLFLGGEGNRDARSYNLSATSAPALKLTYDSDTIPEDGGCTVRTATVQISAGTDDAEERLNDRNKVSLTSTDLEIPRDGWRSQLIGLRFPNLRVPKNAEIISSSIEFEVDQYRSGFLSMQIAGQSHDNPPTFSTDNRDISRRSTTSKKVNWNNLPVLATNAKMTTADLSPIVQEIVNRGGWKSGNAMVFLLSRLSGNALRELESYNGEPASAPTLRVRYKVNIGSSPEETFITAREKLKEVVNNLTASGGTPIVDAYYEAASYMRGDAVDYGKKRGFYTSRFNRVSHPNSYDSSNASVFRNNGCTDADLDNPNCVNERILGTPVYISPVESACQTNHIVLLSDGAATSNSAISKVKSLTGNSNCKDTGDINEQCGEELALWLNDKDHADNITGKQNISTYTIGFNFSGEFLPQLADHGGGSYHTAESAQDLVDVFQTILGDVLSVDTSFVAPGATVNQFNRLTHRDDIYFALFRPNQRPTWSGNLKRYRIGLDDNTGEVTILDFNGNPAVDPDSGFFNTESRSWWREETQNDGNQVGLGGIAEQLEFDGSARRIFTYVGDNNAIPDAGFDLSQTGNSISESNASLTLDRLGLSGRSGTDEELEEYRKTLLKWARGIDVKDEDDDDDLTDWRQHMGDPMHARPVIVNYANASGDPLTTIFVGTNEGYLHAIEREKGHEIFSYVPQELLPNFTEFFENQASTRHPYGLDGGLSVWSDDANDNVQVDAGEEAYLYSGMRRGGRNYYALNISDRLNPKLAWVIEGGTGDYAELGQSWSKASAVRIMLNGAERDVLIFGGGYDTNQDPDPKGALLTRSGDGQGRAIFVADARTGELLWTAQHTAAVAGKSQAFPDMQYSIPSDLRILDADFDGFADQIYVGDMGGQVWRFDLESYHQSGDLMSGGVIANLSGAEYAEQRRFFSEPDVALISDEGERFYSISLGSGWRAHPLDILTDDQFFMIREPHIVGKPAGYGKRVGDSYTPITFDDLANITTLNDTSNTATVQPSDFGWRLDMTTPGEKILGDSITINNQIVFTSFQPALSVGACTTAIGGGSVYTVNVLDGSPTADLDGDDDVDEDDRRKTLAHGGIPPEPAALITEHGPTVLVGPEQPIKPNFDNLTRRTYWIDNGNDFAESEIE